MNYVGQKVLCVNGVFDAGIAEWADCVPLEGVEYTVRNFIMAPDHKTGVMGPAYHLFELANPRSSNGGEVVFSANRFITVRDEVLEVSAKENEKELSEANSREGVGQMTAFFGGRNETGNLDISDVETIIFRLIEMGGCLLAGIERVEGKFEGWSEDTVRVGIIYTSFSRMISSIQSLRRELCQIAIGLQSISGIYVRITEDTLLCQRETFILYRPSLVLKPGKTLDVNALGFVEHKNYLVYTNNMDRPDGLEWLQSALKDCLESWEAFMYTPADWTGADRPGWIADGLFVNPEEFLIWHPNEKVTAAGGAYIQAAR